MLRFVVSISLFLVLAVADALAQPPAVGKRVALLVGVQDYSGTDHADLRYPRKDVEDLGKLLNRPPFPYDEVVVMTSSAKDPNLVPTLANVRARLKAICARLGKDDLVLVALSGHGYQSRPKGGVGQGYFCCEDARLEKPETLLPLQEIYDTLAASGAGLKVLLVDACRGDLKATPKIPIVTRNSTDFEPVQTGPRPSDGMVVLYSCSPGELSYEDRDLRHGVFFHFVLEALGGAAADVDDDAISWLRMADYVSKKVVQYTTKIERTQRPHFKVNVDRDLPLMRLRPGLAYLKEDFSKAEPGTLPAGWMGDELLRVQKLDNLKQLLPGANGSFRATTPKVRVEGDFLLDLAFSSSTQGNIEVVLNGRGSGRAFRLTFTDLSFDQGKILLDGQRMDPMVALRNRDVAVPLRLERIGQRFQVTMGTHTLGVDRPQCGDFESITVVMTSSQDDVSRKPKLFSLSFVPRPKPMDR